ncbi:MULTISPECIES: Fe-S cluster assembly protein NifU [unclassified Roseofilum]|uniref:Fe-S cluster assembly protein NifU n=1 Tax=unclassified Roseofilum TaxID=2620099 RepID=UPI001B25508A|nr:MULTISPECIES: Fe-S cluster assembly protein NifU [unclassified Roseofilum]MBP0008317.1 Fe-S cluster assembly protein NifU [Roseofilum sp. Belize Diploria]MBP0013165.1 Fe-S cluster assembly protein NifU [Roseofilum sp. SID3]MBP0023258.1 Fe-S cluster assembly protein NifU [Roseofilum sp. SID2]MBP0033148.1 Fe-S cluster assembly protein NifU [Roseofilum sp. Belize BBD 4]MBP0039379.1 Fe-S cluster assembly protein NifU [Roseofilum sp. SID1]
MWDYTDKVIDLFNNPHNMGEITPSDCEEYETVAVGDVGSIACGDALRLHLKVNTQTEQIIDARFQTFGCASAIASSSALTDLIQGMTLDQALTLSNREIADFLGGLPEEKMHCSVMGQEALEAAIYNYKGIPLEAEEEDESPLICRCFAITEGKIKRIIQDNHLTTAEQVTNYIKAGGGCGSCLAEIDDILAEVTQERKQQQHMNQVAVETCVELAEKLASASPEPASELPSLTTLQKITLIQQILNDEIRPMVAMDGGDVELYDIESNLVKVILKGACGSCPSVLTTLKQGIEQTLRDRVSDDLIVVAIE